MWETPWRDYFLFILCVCVCIPTAYLDLSCFLMDEHLVLFSDILGTRISEKQLLGDL